MGGQRSGGTQAWSKASHAIGTNSDASLSGTADASRSQSVEAAIQQRDSDIKAYFDTHLLKHVLNPDHQKRALALTREICGLKVAHQQLIAAHAAAKKLVGSASLQSVTLRQQLQVCKPFASAYASPSHLQVSLHVGLSACCCQDTGPGCISAEHSYMQALAHVYGHCLCICTCTYLCVLVSTCCTVMACVLYCTVLYCTVLYCTVLYCTVLYCTALYCTGCHGVQPLLGHSLTLHLQSSCN